MPYLRALHKAYRDYIRLPWSPGLSGSEKCLFVLYPPDLERRLRAHAPEFELATKEAGHAWVLCDLTDAFAEWMAAQEYAESYFEEPDLLEPALDDFLKFAAGKVRTALTAADESTVVAVLGVASLFGFVRVSRLLTEVEADIPGRLAVFFPGEYRDSQYALLGVYHGWNYHAVPIKPSELSLS